MDFRIINDETLPKIMELWDYCFGKKTILLFLSGILMNTA